MPELRRDPLLNRWVVIAPERARRPQHYDDKQATSAKPDPSSDPFAEGNEGLTTPEIYALRPDGSAPNGPGWTLRVVANKYPALHVESEWQEPVAEGLTDHCNAIGAHEVVIETPDSGQLADLPGDRIADVLTAFRVRMDDLYRDRRIVQVVPFKNHGRAGGATLPHSHSQIVGLPFVSPTLRTQLESLKSHWVQYKRSMFEDIVGEEMRSGERIVLSEDGLLAHCPYASGFPFEVTILPTQAEPDFRSCGDSTIGTLASMLKAILLKWRRVLGDVPYNFVLHSAPGESAFVNVRDEYPDLDSYYRWHLQLFPRITHQAGFEWGTGSHINIVPPEEASAALREVEVTL